MLARRKFAAVGAAYLALGVLIFFGWRTHRRLTAEAVALHRRNQEVVRLRQGNRSLAESVAQLRELRKAQIDSVLARRAMANATEHDASTDVGFTSIADLKNAGTKTVHDAYETYLWALDNLDLATLARLLVPQDAASRDKIRAVYAALPPADQEQYESAEEMFAMIYAWQHQNYFSAMRVTSEEPAPDAREAAPTVQFEYSNGHTTTHDNGIYLNRMPDGGWGLTLDSWQVNSALEQLKKMGSASQAP